MVRGKLTGKRKPPALQNAANGGFLIRIASIQLRFGLNRVDRYSNAQ
ncbi:hypothetical protein GGQ85_001938 [Nitrobacter vulgaris]|nr:hypothetical protein [Nitrobacter vulgaris]